MPCAVDDILKDSTEAIRGNMEQLVTDLITDFNLQLDSQQALASPEAETLRGAMQTFAVWAVRQGRK